MTGHGEDLLAWLDNAISLHEAAATAAATPYGGRWVQGFPEHHKDPEMRYAWDADMVHLSQEDPHVAYQCMSDEIAALTVLNDPESVLRRCAADRKSLRLYAETLKMLEKSRAEIKSARDQGTSPSTTALNNWGESNSEIAVMMPFIQNLAEGYGWTPAATSAPDSAQTSPIEGDQVT